MRMCFSCAPIASRMPISRVRSVTETSMMFMMPMPPTRRLTPATTTMTGMLGAVAGVSLLVGGIGIMDIMLVSVTERTREIGIRLAIGAHERHILVQFLVEATVLSLLGGLIGIALGLGLAGAASAALSIPFAPSAAVILLAVGFSALIGMVFGFFPALRGARLDPIEALRHE